MGTSPSWVKSPETWDRIVIAGETFSGPVQVDFKLGRKRDVAAAPGVNGGTIRDAGEKLCPVTIRLELWLDEHWAFYTKVLVPLVQPKLPSAASSASTSSPNGQPENFFIRTPYPSTPYGPVPYESTYTGQLEEELQNPTAFQVVTPLGILAGKSAAASTAARKRALAPVAVYHPSLAGADIRLLHLDELSSVKKLRHGVYEVELKGHRYTAKKSAAVTTSTAGATDSGLSGIRLAPELTGRPAPPSTTDSKP